MYPRAVGGGTVGGRFRQQRYAVRIPTSAKKILSFSKCRKDENKEKEAGIGPFPIKKKTILYLSY